MVRDDFITPLRHLARDEQETPRGVSIISGNGLACVLRSPFFVVFALELPDLASFHLRQQVDAVLAVALASENTGADDPSPDPASCVVEHDDGLSVEKVAEKVLERVPSERGIVERQTLP